MASDFKRGDHVEWNSEAGRVRGTIQKKVTSEITFKGYKRHASKEEPQYIIKSDKTDHLAIHKGSALKKIKKEQQAIASVNHLTTKGECHAQCQKPVQGNRQVREVRQCDGQEQVIVAVGDIEIVSLIVVPRQSNSAWRAIPSRRSSSPRRS